MLKFLGLVSVTLVLGDHVWAKREFAMPSEANIAKAKAILDKTPIIDGHNDFIMGTRSLIQNDFTNFDFNSDLTQVEPWASYVYNHVDLPRIRDGRLGGQFWSSYVSCRSAHKDAVQLFMEQNDAIKRLVALNSDHMEFVTTAAGVEAAMANGKVASMIGVESGHAINSNLGILRMLYEVGTRYMTLTHTCNTPWADAAQAESGSQPVRSDGLSPFGVEVILEMNRLGMFVDVSHVSSAVMSDALDVSRAPIIFSHSSARAVNNVVRNVPDSILERMPDNGGVVMVNFYSCFIKDDCDATLDDVVDHVNHVRNVAGVDHVGIGSDFCGIDEVPLGLEDVSKYPILFAALLESDVEWTDEDLGKLANGNLLRAMKEMETVRDSLSGEAPHQGWISSEDFEPDETSCMSEMN
ncbi:dipeptidase 1-like [Tigriopus californicus]|nr:dipeptidase 1-like [Tigriopus californicus]